MAEMRAVIESSPIKVINPTQSRGGKKLDPRLDPLYIKSHHIKFQLKRLRNVRDMGWAVISPYGINLTNRGGGGKISP